MEGRAGFPFAANSPGDLRDEQINQFQSKRAGFGGIDSDRKPYAIVLNYEIDLVTVDYLQQYLHRPTIRPAKCVPERIAEEFIYNQATEARGIDTHNKGWRSDLDRDVLRGLIIDLRNVLNQLP